MTPELKQGLVIAIVIVFCTVAGHYHGVATTLGAFVNFNAALMERLK